MIIKLLEPIRVPEKKIEELAKPLIDAGHEFIYYDEKTTDIKELAERSIDADIVIIANNPYPKEAFEYAEQLKYIDVAFTGVDHVDVKAATDQGIKISNASGYANTAVAELVLGLNLALYRQQKQSDYDVRQGQAFQAPIQGREIKGKTVGIVGTGAIGLETAELYRAFGAKLLGYNQSESKAGLALGIEYTNLETLMKESDIITLHLPSDDSTKGIISKEMIALMKEDAILINIARGPIVDNQALADALNANQIGGAGIDVYEMEPPLPNDYPLLDAKNTILMPHVGFLTDEAMALRADIAFDNVYQFIEGKPQNLMN